MASGAPDVTTATGGTLIRGKDVVIRTHEDGGKDYYQVVGYTKSTGSAVYYKMITKDGEEFTLKHFRVPGKAGARLRKIEEVITGSRQLHPTSTSVDSAKVFCPHIIRTIESFEGVIVRPHGNELVVHAQAVPLLIQEKHQGTLLDHCQDRRFAVMDALQVAYRLVQAVQHLKINFNLSHCDISPLTVVAVSKEVEGQEKPPQPTFKLTEFTLCTDVDDKFQGYHNDAVEWQAPELFKRSLKQQRRVLLTAIDRINPDKLDVYGIGMCLFYMLYGEEPAWIAYKKPELLTYLMKGDSDAFWTTLSEMRPLVVIPEDVKCLLFDMLLLEP